MRALMPGSYDPVTVGHLAVIEATAARYDRVTVALFINPNKKGLFPHEIRLTLLRLATAHLPNVDVIFSDGMVADYARAGGYDRIVKGVRSRTDLLYEEEMAAFNLERGGVPTELVPAEEAYAAVSSTAVRRALAAGDQAALSLLLPPSVLEEALSAYRSLS